jgi:hypothetical protein
MIITPPYRPMPEWTSPQPTQAVDAFGSVVKVGDQRDTADMQSIIAMSIIGG